MKRMFTLAVAAVCTTGMVHAQTECGNGRYTDYDHFTDVDVTNAVTFGNNQSVGGGPVDLKMDIYEPAGDTESSRPVVIVQFGGSFIFGNRADVESQCRYFAKMGYVAVAPDYRTGFFNPSEVTTTLAVIRAMHDMKAAVRYLRKTVAEDGNPYGIDPERIIVGGISAGAIGAIHAAYLDDDAEIPAYLENDTAGLGGVEGNSGTPGYPSDVLGVVSYSGAIGDTSWIGAGDSPILSIHEELDATVPYNTTEVAVSGIATGLIASGSRDIHARASNLGNPNCLMAFAGVENHVGYLMGSFNPEVKALVRDFCAGLVCGNSVGCNSTLYVGTEEVSRERLGVYPNPAAEVLNFTAEAGTTYEVIDMTGRTVMSGSANAGTHRLDVSQLISGSYVLRVIGEEMSTAHFIKQ